jgi:hypothetical protein
MSGASREGDLVTPERLRRERSCGRVLHPDAVIEALIQVLEAVERLGRESALAVDSRNELREQLRRAVGVAEESREASRAISRAATVRVDQLSAKLGRRVSDLEGRRDVEDLVRDVRSLERRVGGVEQRIGGDRPTGIEEKVEQLREDLRDWTERVFKLEFKVDADLPDGLRWVVTDGKETLERCGSLGDRVEQIKVALDGFAARLGELERWREQELRDWLVGVENRERERLLERVEAIEKRAKPAAWPDFDPRKILFDDFGRMDPVSRRELDKRAAEENREATGAVDLEQGPVERPSLAEAAAQAAVTAGRAGLTVEEVRRNLDRAARAGREAVLRLGSGPWQPSDLVEKAREDLEPLPAAGCSPLSAKAYTILGRVEHGLELIRPIEHAMDRGKVALETLGRAADLARELMRDLEGREGLSRELGAQLDRLEQGETADGENGERWLLLGRDEVFDLVFAIRRAQRELER